MKKTLLSVATVTALTGIASHNISAAEYTVESGDTLWSLANESGTSVSTLKEVNELSGDLIVPGDVLEVDAEPSEEDAQENDGTYVIKSGDTLFEIGQKFDVDYQKIMEWNNLSTDMIYAGKTLIVAASAAPANETVEEAPAVQEAPAVEEEQAEVVEEAPAVEETEQDQPSAPAAAQNDNQAAEQAAAEQRAAEQRAAEERAAEQAAAEERAAEQAAAEQRAAEQAEAERQERIQQREAEQAEAQEQQSQQAQQSQTQQVSTGGGNAASVARSVAAGKSYVYGGNTASVVDCSALTQQFMQAYKGKSIPRTAAAQMAAGTQVSNPQPGDLVFFNGGSHVGIYIGNGQMIDALNPSEGVGQRSVSYVNGTIDGYFRY